MLIKVDPKSYVKSTQCLSRLLSIIHPIKLDQVIKGHMELFSNIWQTMHHLRGMDTHRCKNNEKLHLSSYAL